MKIYPIDRKMPIKQFDDLSLLNGHRPVSSLKLKIPAEENFVLQLAVLPEGEREITSIQTYGKTPILCINTEITDHTGKYRQKAVSLTDGEIQPLFFVIGAEPENKGAEDLVRITFQTDMGEQTLTLEVRRTDEPVAQGGDSELWRLSRLRWLNSSRFLDDKPVPPYFAPERNGNTIRILGRDIRIGQNGLPEAVTIYFDESILLRDTPQKKLFCSPMEFCLDGETILYDAPTFTSKDGHIDIAAHGCSEHFDLTLAGRLYYEGALHYSIAVAAKADAALENIRLETSLSPDCADYMNGLGATGGKAHDTSFRWNPAKHWDCLYVGAVNAGIRLKWKAEHYRRPLVNIYYKNLPLVIPETTWDNHGNGGVTFEKEADKAEISAFTGRFSMHAGEVRRFDFEIHLTPFSPIDYKKHYAVRYSHNDNLTNGANEIRRAKANGLNYINVHHGNPLNPIINYPFLETKKLKAFVEAAKEKDIAVKVYYTTREHSNHMAEVFAYKALGDEIILRKKGEGYPHKGGVPQWLVKYFGDEIIPAWKVDFPHGKYKNDPDITFIVHPGSRLDNYYIEGLDYLVRNMGIKGIYIDDTAMDRTTLERAKKVLMPVDGLIDMHMWNHECDVAGDISCMNLYTELLPFLDSLWIGEGYRYRRMTPEFLLMEVSGIPYGKTSAMLQDGGDPYIGMLYAMNNRFGWTGVTTATRMYRLWDDFGIEDSEMRGYWHSKNPVATGNDSVLSTVYLKTDSALVCLFNFSGEVASFPLKIDEEKLGFPVGKAEAAFIPGLQRKKKISLDREISLAGKDGIILLLRR